MSDLISRQDAIDALERKKDKNAKGDIGGFYNKIIQNDVDALMRLPSAEPERETGRWTTDEVAELLRKMFGDDCACNYNGIDEWLPMNCQYANTTCPHPEEKNGCWKQFLTWSTDGGGA